MSITPLSFGGIILSDKDAKKIVWFLNQKLKEGKIAALAVTLIEPDGGSYSGYAINQCGLGKEGLYSLIGAVQYLNQRLINHGTPEPIDIMHVLEACGLVSLEEGD